MSCSRITSRYRYGCAARRWRPACLAKPVVAAEGMNRLPGTLQQQAVDGFLMEKGQPAKFRRQGEGNQEIAGRHLPLQLFLQLALALMGLTVRAMAVHSEWARNCGGGMGGIAVIKTICSAPQAEQQRQAMGATRRRKSATCSITTGSDGGTFRAGRAMSRLATHSPLPAL